MLFLVKIQHDGRAEIYTNTMMQSFSP